MNKSVSFEVTLNKKEIESIIRAHVESKLEQEDVDFRKSKWLTDDYTYNFKDGNPSIDVVIILDSVEMRKK